MKLIKYLFLTPFILFSTFQMNAQSIDVGVLLGGSYYLGEIVSDFQPSTIGGSGGAFVRYNFNDRLALKGFGGYARVSGDDKLNTGSARRLDRNWQFFTNIFEGSVQLEYSLVSDRNGGRRLYTPFIPYVFAGVGAFYFQPKTQILGGGGVGLSGLALSGNKYEQTVIAIPMGLGFKYYLTSKLYVGFEFGIRFTTTSYIDDIANNDKFVSPSKTSYPGITGKIYSKSVTNEPGTLRGNAKPPILTDNDIYIISGFTLAYKFGKNRGGGGFRGKAVRCPRFY